MKSTDPAPERILILGLEGSGKTNCWASTAEHYRTSKSPGRFYVVNTEPSGAIERTGSQWPDFTENVEWTDVKDWQSLRAATTKYLDAVSSDDWIIVDSADRAWEWCRQAYDEGWAEFNGIQPSGMFGFGAKQAPKDDKMWDRINGEYQAWMIPLLGMDTNPAHLMSIAPAQPLRVEGLFKDDDAVIAEFKQWGVRASGQKHLGFQHHTKLLMRHRGPGEYTMTTMGKDRAREEVDNVPLVSFAMSYLYQVAKWEL